MQTRKKLTDYDARNMTGINENTERSRRLRERRKLGLVAVSVGTPRGTVRGAIPPKRAAQVRQWIEEEEKQNANDPAPSE